MAESVDMLTDLFTAAIRYIVFVLAVLPVVLLFSTPVIVVRALWSKLYGKKGFVKEMLRMYRSLIRELIVLFTLPPITWQ